MNTERLLAQVTSAGPRLSDAGRTGGVSVRLCWGTVLMYRGCGSLCERRDGCWRGTPGDEDTVDDPEELIEQVRRAREQERDETTAYGDDAAGSDDDLTVAGQQAPTPPAPGSDLDDESTIAPDPAVLRRLRSETRAATEPAPPDDDATVVRGTTAPRHSGDAPPHERDVPSAAPSPEFAAPTQPASPSISWLAKRGTSSRRLWTAIAPVAAVAVAIGLLAGLLLADRTDSPTGATPTAATELQAEPDRTDTATATAGDELDRTGRGTQDETRAITFTTEAAIATINEDDDEAGDGETQVHSPPVVFTAITAGRGHTCGLRTDGTAICWGQNDYGQADPPT